MRTHTHPGATADDVRGRRDDTPRIRPARAALVTAVAGVAALLAWGLAHLAGLDPVVSRGGRMTPVTTVDVVVAVVVVGLAAWGVQGFLRRRGHASWWPFTGSTTLAISMIGPSYQADGASAVVLMVLHLVVGAVLIAGLQGVTLAHLRRRRRTG